MLHPLIRGQSTLTIVYKGLAAAVFVGAIFALCQRKRSQFTALVLGIPSLIGLFTIHWIPDASPVPPVVFIHCIPIVFLTYTVIVILKGAFEQPEVSFDSINGAFCGYLLIGLVFGHLFCMAEFCWPNSFIIQEQLGKLPADEHHRHWLLTYFSLITLTTVGYGDIIPLSAAARTLAWLEAVIGQFYIAVIVAQLISLNVASALRKRGLG